MLSVDLASVVALESFVEAAPERARKAMSFAMNDVIGGPGLSRYRFGVGEQINLSPSYINDRLTFDQRARPDNLTATIVGRQRPTSLARFAQGVVPGQKGVSVRVKAQGGATRLPGAFLVRLNAGASNDDGYNLGLAVRLKPGQTHIGSKKDTSRMVHLSANVVLLYGPSIDQVLNNSVIDAETPEVISATATEFYRQFARLAD